MPMPSRCMTTLHLHTEVDPLNFDTPRKQQSDSRGAELVPEGEDAVSCNAIQSEETGRRQVLDLIGTASFEGDSTPHMKAQAKFIKVKPSQIKSVKKPSHRAKDTARSSEKHPPTVRA